MHPVEPHLQQRRLSHCRMENQERKGLDILHENSPTSPSTSGTTRSSLECRPTYGSNVPLNGAWNGGSQGSNVPLNGASDGGACGNNVSLSGALNGGACGNNVPLNGALNGGAQGSNVPLNGALDGGARGSIVPLNGALNIGACGSSVSLRDIWSGDARESLFSWDAIWSQEKQTFTQNGNVQSFQNHGNELHQLSNSQRTSTFPLIWTSDPSDTFQGSQYPYCAEMNNDLHGYRDQGLCCDGEGFGIHHGENAAYRHATATPMSNGLTNVVPRIGCNSAESFQLPPVNCGYSSRPRQVYNSVDVVTGKIYYLAKDHERCSFLRMILKEGTAKDVQKVLNELANHFIELSSHPSGNSLVRNLLELCSTDQRKFIVSQLTRNPGKLFRISCDKHGVQVVRKVIEVIKDSDEILWVVTALRPHAAALMKDDNGCLVVEHCLKFLSPEHSQFLFDVAIACSADLAMDPKGCCTLQNCIRHSTGEQKDKLAIAIASLALTLSDDGYGNYAVQCVLEYGTPSSKSLILDLLRGHHVDLSKKKYASNVVEKCLCIAERDNNEDIILELVRNPNFSHLAGDQYGNYVVQTALQVSKGPLRAALVNAIKPHAAKLRTSPFTKKVLSAVGLTNK